MGRSFLLLCFLHLTVTSLIFSISDEGGRFMEEEEEEEEEAETVLVFANVWICGTANTRHTEST